MSLPVEEITAEMERVLKSLEEQGNELIPSVRPTLKTNLERGRIQSFIEENVGCIDDYVQKVLGNYKQLNPLIHQLTVERAAEAWEPLFPKMQRWAYNLLIGKNFYPDKNTREIATECATEAAINMLNAYFPYDTDFEPWVRVIIVHACQKYIRKGMSGIPERNLIDLGEQSNLEDPTTRDAEFQQHIRDDLSAALAKLPTLRRQVIKLTYFSELPPAEIAGKMNKSIGAIYSLHFNGLHDLQKIMSQTTDDAHE